MAKRAKVQPTRLGKTVLTGGIGMMLGIPGLPAQIRDSARERQPRPPAFVPKGKRGRRGR
jgi:hypothetical protein